MNATSRDHGELTECVDRLAACIGEPQEYLIADWALHRRIADCCANDLVA